MNILSSLYTFVALLAGAGILFLVFKTRYLDYYVCKDEASEIIKEDNQTEEKKEFKQKKEKQIIIRDPKHGEYRFINGLIKCFVVGMKCFAGILLAFFGLAFIGLCAGFILAFLLSKTGLFFIGILVVLLASGVLVGGICFILLNFIMNRKVEKKYIIYGFLGSLLCFGVGCGLTFTGSLNFNVIHYCNHSTTQTITHNGEIKPIDTLYPVEYIEEERNDIKIECDILHSDIRFVDEGDCYYLTVRYDEFELLKEFISHLNKYELLDYTPTIKIYASQDVINTLKENPFNSYE